MGVTLGPIRNRSMYEPIHGSAPDIAGKNVANPIGTILSCAMMMRYSFNMEDPAKAIEEAVHTVLEAGLRTADIYDSAKSGTRLVSCSEMGDAVADELKKIGGEPPEKENLAAQDAENPPKLKAKTFD